MAYLWSIEGDITTAEEPYVRLKDGDHPDLTDENFDLIMFNQAGDIRFRHTGGGVALARLQSAFAKTNSGTTISPTLGAGATAGNMLILFGAYVDPGGAGTFINIQTNGWRLAGGTTRHGGITYAIAIKLAEGGETAQALQPSIGSTEIIGWIAEYEGFGGYVSTDLSERDTGTGTTASMAESNQTEEKYELMVLGVVNEGAAAQSSPTNGYAQIATDATTSLRLGLYDKIVNALETPACDVTIASSQDWIAGHLTFSPHRTVLGIDANESDVKIANGIWMRERRDEPNAPVGTASERAARLFLQEHSSNAAKSELVIQWESGVVEIIKQET